MKKPFKSIIFILTPSSSFKPRQGSWIWINGWSISAAFLENDMKYDYKLQLKPRTRFCCRLTIQFPPLCWAKMNIFSDSHPQRKGSYNIISTSISYYIFSTLPKNVQKCVVISCTLSSSRVRTVVDQARLARLMLGWEEWIHCVFIALCMDSIMVWWL